MKLTFNVPDDMVLGFKKVIDKTMIELNKRPLKEGECYYITVDDEILYQKSRVQA